MKRQVIKPIFFIGVPRSGTTIIYEQFSQHEELGWISNYQNRLPGSFIVSSINKLFDNPMLHKIGKRPDSSKTNTFFLSYPKATEPYIFWDHYTKENFSRDFLLGKKADSKLADKMNSLHAKILRKQNKKRLSTKFTGPARIEYIKSIFPDALFVHIIRDGRAVVRSLLNVDFWKEGGGLEKPWWINGDDSALYKKHPSWNSKPHILAAIQWLNIIEKTLQERDAFLNDQQYIEVKYESFIQNPKETMELLFEFASLSKNSRVLNSIINKQKIDNKNKKYKEDFSGDQLNDILSVIQGTLQQLGYE